MKNLLAIAFYFYLIIPISCQNFHGVYKATKKDVKYILILKDDNTFEFTIKYQDYSPHCTGVWKFQKSKGILLKCNEVENIYETLTNEYTPIREYKVKVINSKKLLINGVKLKKEKKSISKKGG